MITATQNHYGFTDKPPQSAQTESQTKPNNPNVFIFPNANAILNPINPNPDDQSLVSLRCWMRSLRQHHSIVFIFTVAIDVFMVSDLASFLIVFEVFFSCLLMFVGDRGYGCEPFFLWQFEKSTGVYPAETSDLICGRVLMFWAIEWYGLKMTVVQWSLWLCNIWCLRL